jgi:hypothetical protein
MSSETTVEPLTPEASLLLALEEISRRPRPR